MNKKQPLPPIPMYPSYRYGESTPWGGQGLKMLFGRNIPDERTGESLEISVIPGLESKTGEGITLSGLLNEYGEAITGSLASKPFPLLLKLLSASSPLSVQVHPNDEYAAKNEGKLGKTEAWVILHAEPGATLLFGVNDGVTKEDIRRCLLNDMDIEPLIRKVQVKAGDVLYIPSGMIHAIGSGITLYEIQQSSDVTYRLWDYNRTTAYGEKRPLHIQQALDTIDTELTMEVKHIPDVFSGIIHLLDVPAFRLDALAVNGTYDLPLQHTFRIFTAIEPLTVCWQGEEAESIVCNSGDTLLLPANGYPLTIEGNGRALISMP